MKSRWFLAFILPVFFTFYSTTSRGAEFCVVPDGSGETDLQTALDIADSNGQDDTIKIVQGIYNGNFSYSSNQGYSLTLLGGYTTSCSNRIVDPSNTILDGGKSDSVLVINDSAGGDITIEGITIQNGFTSNYGAGLCANSSIASGTSGNIIFTNSTVVGNTTTGTIGGGVYINSQSNSGTAGTVTLTNNTVLKNSAQNYGGIYARSFAINGLGSTVTFTENRVYQNNATDTGGGVYVYSEGSTGSGTITLTNNILSENTATNDYGAIQISTTTNTGTAGNIYFVNNIITDNAADYYAGVTIGSEASSGIAGTVTLTGNTISQNVASTRNGGAYIPMDSNTNNVYNNIIWGNTAPERADINLTGIGNAYGFNNDFSVMSGSWTSGETNINSDPGFIDPDNGDFRLRSNSSCKDVGNNTAPSIPSNDFEGDSRIIDTTVDIGADEVSVVTTCVSNATDLQNALTTAKNNYKSDVIMVQQGNYSGNFSYNSGETYDLTLLGGYSSMCSSRAIDPSKTILDGSGTGSVLALTYSGKADMTVNGFTLHKGASLQDGGGIAAQNSSSNPSSDIYIYNNIIKNNNSNMNGGGISANSYSTGDSGNITLINNLIFGNNAQGTSRVGGGINAATFSTSGGSAGRLTLINNTISGNSSTGNGGGMYLNASTNGVVIAHNNIIWGNTAASSGGDIYLSKGSGAVATAYCNDASDVGGSDWDFDSNNIGIDPLFTGDYHLKSKSPCIDTGINTAAALTTIDIQGSDRIIDGNRDDTEMIDMGAFEYVPKGVLSFILLLLN